MANHRYKMISSMRYSIGIYERFYKVQKGGNIRIQTTVIKAQIWRQNNKYFTVDRDQKLNSSKELKIAE